MTSQKRDPYWDSDKYGPFLQQVARALYENAQFSIISARPFIVFRSLPISKLEKDPGEYIVKQIKT